MSLDSAFDDTHNIRTMVYISTSHTAFVALVAAVALGAAIRSVDALIPLIDGGKGIPKIYDGYFNEQIAKQACTAVSKAIAAGKMDIEVNFPPVPNVEEGTLHFSRIWQCRCLQSSFQKFARFLIFWYLCSNSPFWYAIKSKIWKNDCGKRFVCSRRI